jgi:hypothetical protein
MAAPLALLLSESPTSVKLHVFGIEKPWDHPEGQLFGRTAEALTFVKG